MLPTRRKKALLMGRGLLQTFWIFAKIRWKLYFLQCSVVCSRALVHVELYLATSICGVILLPTINLWMDTTWCHSILCCRYHYSTDLEDRPGEGKIKYDHTCPGGLSTSMWVIIDNSTFPQYHSHVWWRIGVSRILSPGNFCTIAKISGEFAKALKVTFFGSKRIYIFIIHTKE